MTDTKPVALCAWCIGHARGYANNAAWCTVTAMLLSLSWTGVFGGAEIPDLTSQVICSIVFACVTFLLVAVQLLLGWEVRAVIAAERQLNPTIMRNVMIQMWMASLGLISVLIATVVSEHPDTTATVIAVAIGILGALSLVNIFKSKAAMRAAVVSQARVRAQCPHPPPGWRSS